MKKIIIFTIIAILSSALSALIFSFVVAEKLYFPEIREIASDTAAGLHLTAYQYDPWLWNREKVTIINILDRKNDAPNFQYKLKGEIYSVQLIHSGEDYAIITYDDPNFSSMNSGYIVHRSPKSESENTIDEIHMGGYIFAVAPDESGYFYISEEKIYKRDWHGKTLISAELGMTLEPIFSIQQIGVGSRQAFHPAWFFSNNTKMAFGGRPVGERDEYLFIWDLENNEIEKIPGQDLGDYHDLFVEDNKLYGEKKDFSSSKKLIAE